MMLKYSNGGKSRKRNHVTKKHSMGEKTYLSLSTRERQSMDLLYRFDQATAAEVQANLPEPPGYSAVWSTLRILSVSLAG